jgi:hypothetical protein
MRGSLTWAGKTLILLLRVYAKNVQEDIDATQKKILVQPRDEFMESYGDWPSKDRKGAPQARRRRGADRELLGGRRLGARRDRSSGCGSTSRPRASRLSQSAGGSASAPVAASGND